MKDAKGKEIGRAQAEEKREEEAEVQSIWGKGECQGPGNTLPVILELGSRFAVNRSKFYHIVLSTACAC